ncbi:MAG: hypothetical protein WC455_19735 [Dehalococcoidia bacterium]|jgi:hypothetical protein
MDVVIFDRIPPRLGVVKPDDKKDILLPGEVGAVLDWVVSDPKTGRITEQRAIKSHSFLKQFLHILYVKFNLLGSSTFNTGGTPPHGNLGTVLSTLDITNTARDVIHVEHFEFVCLGAAASVTSGIIIGTGVTAPTITDYKIETIIPHATMNYGAQTFGNPTADATTSQLTITRNFANVSGGDVTVNEIALYCGAYAGGSRDFCIIRDVIAGGITVPNGQTLTVNYRPQVVI